MLAYGRELANWTLVLCWTAVRMPRQFDARQALPLHWTNVQFARLANLTRDERGLRTLSGAGFEKLKAAASG